METCWSSCWRTASRRWCRQGWRAWSASPRMGCGYGPQRARHRFVGIRPCRNAGVRRSRRLPICARNSRPIPAQRRASKPRHASARPPSVSSGCAALAVTAELHAQQQEQARLETERAAAQAQQDAAKAAKKTKTTDAEKTPAEPRASTTDAEARTMKIADGGFRPAYNVQFAADTESTAIAGVSVDNIGSDMGKMAPMSDALAELYGERPSQHLADGGFAKLDDIDALAGNGVEVFVPVPKPRNASRDRHVPLRGDSPAVAAWRQRLGKDAAQEIYKERAATVELANAQTRNHGLRQFVVRGLEKVKATTLWFALAHNMMCGWRLLAA